MGASGSPTALSIRWVDQDGSPAAPELTSPEVIIGRDPSSSLRLDDVQVSRRHARIEVAPDHLVITDLGSRNGTYVNSERTQSAELGAGDRVRIGHTILEVVGPPGDPGQEPGATVQIAVSSDGATVVTSDRGDGGLTERLPEIRSAPAAQRGVVPDDLLQQPVVSEAELATLGIQVEVVPCLALGGGMGSFQWADLLRIGGISADQIRVVSNESTPYGRYERLCLNSQIPNHERLRSNSDSRPDNPWGFPSYAVVEVARDLAHGRLRSAGRTLWSIFGEPALAQTYTPRSGDVFRSLDREMARIGWSQMLVPGRVRGIRSSSVSAAGLSFSVEDIRGPTGRDRLDQRCGRAPPSRHRGGLRPHVVRLSRHSAASGPGRVPRRDRRTPSRGERVRAPRRHLCHDAPSPDPAATLGGAPPGF